MQEQELFQGYELKGWELNQRIYKILGASTLVSLLSLFVIGQTELLTTKGCDSPFVGQVCNVLDTVYTGGAVLTADSGTIDQDYTPSELAEADIVFINTENQFKYPEGYFALSNPELQNPTTMFDANGNPIPGSSYLPDGSISLGGMPPTTPGGTTDLLNKPQELPKPNDNAVVGTLPDSPVGFDPSPTTPPRVKTTRPRKWTQKLPDSTLGNTSPNVLPRPTNETTAETKKPDETKTDPNAKPSPAPADDIAKDEQNGIYRNRKPLRDFGEKALPKVDKIKLDSPFTVIVTGSLEQSADNKDITILKDAKLVKAEAAPSDAELAKLVQDAILAIGDSGWLGYLKKFGAKNITFTLTQNNNELSATVVADYDDANKAKTGASLLSLAIQVGRAATDEDEKYLLEKATSDWVKDTKSSRLNFTLPKTEAQAMIQRRLEKIKEEAAKRAKNPQGTSAASENNQTAAK